MTDTLYRFISVSVNMKQTFSKRHLRTILTLLETGFFVKTIFGGKKAGAVSGRNFVRFLPGFSNFRSAHAKSRNKLVKS